MQTIYSRRRWVLWALAIPFNIIAWFWLLLMVAIYAAHDLRVEPGGVLTAVWRPWAAKRWRYSTTLGHAIIYQPGRRAPVGAVPTRIQEHEHVHVRQAEDDALRSVVLAAFVFTWWAISPGTTWRAALMIWVFSYAWKSTNFLAAWLRGLRVYRDTEHERSAYAQTDERDGISWLEENSLL